MCAAGNLNFWISERMPSNICILFRWKRGSDQGSRKDVVQSTVYWKNTIRRPVTHKNILAVRDWTSVFKIINDGPPDILR